MLINFINVIPRGMVVFLPSYSFLNTVIFEWKTNGTLAKFCNKKKVGLNDITIHFLALTLLLGVFRTTGNQRRGACAARLFHSLS